MRLIVCFTIALAAATTIGSQTQSSAKTARPAVDMCAALGRVDFSGTIDAPTQIVSARVAGGDANPTERHCEVQGYVAPNVGFVIWMPLARWNGKLLQLGCGGHCGSTSHIIRCTNALKRGYACAVTDGGHQSSSAQALWAYNNWQAQIDYFLRANHVTTLAARSVLSRYFDGPVRHSFFIGCSAGGREALMQAQRFPWDHDGIVAGCPSLNQTDIRMNLLWTQRAFSDAKGHPIITRTDVERLHKAVVAECDSIDGLKDGLLEDPRNCRFDPSTLLCRSNENAECFTRSQVEAIRKAYQGARTSDGQQIVLPGPMPGSEKTWTHWFLAPHQTGMTAFVQEAFRYYGFNPSPGVNWRVADFDFDRDYKRLSLSESLFAATNPDLRRFKSAGGKLIAYTGWNDAAGMPLPIIDYYESAQKLAGGPAQTQDFFRLFVIPGMNHCGGGDGAFAIDFLKHLEDWVEDGVAPDKLLSYHVSLDPSHPLLSEGMVNFPLIPGTVKFSRPIYPYPTTVRYRGSGDPNLASSFVAAE
jgi:feruloyl esterase